MGDAKEPLAPGYVKDVRMLLRSFAEAGQTSLPDFKALWASRSFSFIHEGCPKNVNPRRYQQILYTVALGFLQQYRLCRQMAEAEQQQQQNLQQEQRQQPQSHRNRQHGSQAITSGRGAVQSQAASPADVQGMAQQADAGTAQLETPTLPQSTVSAAAAAVYCIYCLYYTQHCSPRTLIYVSPEDVETMNLFAADTGVHHEAWEALLCLQRLNKEDAFLYGAVPFREKDAFGCTEEEAAAHRKVLDKQRQVMKDRLFCNLPLERHLSTDLGKVLGVAAVERFGQQYKEALRAIPKPPAPSEEGGNGSEAGPSGRQKLNEDRPAFAEGKLSKILQP